MTRVVVDRELCMRSGVCEHKDPVLLTARKLAASLGAAIRACPTGVPSAGGLGHRPLSGREPPFYLGRYRSPLS
jgi:hypothetical protein